MSIFQKLFSNHSNIEPEVVTGNFEGHYCGWRAKRLIAIINHFGVSNLYDKSILELGCGYADIGGTLSNLGANVTCTDAREEHLSVAQNRFPYIKTARLDLDKESITEDFDIIIHMGVLYHLANPQSSLENACRHSSKLILETEVVDSDCISASAVVAEEGYDQAFNNTGIRLSATTIENILASNGFSFECIKDNRCNHGMHRYDWPVTNSGRWEHGMRRFWFAEKK